MLFSEISWCRTLALLSKDWWALIALCKATNNSWIDSNFLIVCLAGEMTRQLKMWFLYTLTCAFFRPKSLSGVLCFVSYSSLSFDVWLSDLNCFTACGALLMDFLFPNVWLNVWEIPKLWNALKDWESDTCDWDFENEVEALSGVRRNWYGEGNVKLLCISSTLVISWCSKSEAMPVIPLLRARRSCSASGGCKSLGQGNFTTLLPSLERWQVVAWQTMARCLMIGCCSTSILIWLLVSSTRLILIGLCLCLFNGP